MGGGPAGCAAAIVLARGGVSPLLIERAAGDRNVVCGGFLGWDALAALRRLGVDADALGAGRITRLRLISGRERVDAALPRPAAGLSRRALDRELMRLAVESGANALRGIGVKAADPAGHSVRLDDGKEIACEALLLATGKHELRGLARPLANRTDLAAGLRVSLPATATRQAALAGTIELHLFDGGYAGLLLQEDGTANLCFSVSRRRLSAAGSPKNLLTEIVAEAPILGERLEGQLPAELEAVAGVPYGWIAKSTGPGVFRLGDQAGVIASLAGDGIAIALTSGEGAARALLDGGPEAAHAWQGRFAARARRPIHVAEALRHAAERATPRNVLMQIIGFAPGLATAAAGLTRIGKG